MNDVNWTYKHSDLLYEKMKFYRDIVVVQRNFFPRKSIEFLAMKLAEINFNVYLSKVAKQLFPELSDIL